jgi:hypothetical protein
MSKAGASASGSPKFRARPDEPTEEGAKVFKRWIDWDFRCIQPIRRIFRPEWACMIQLDHDESFAVLFSTP